MKTESRLKKISNVLSLRQKDVTIVIEDIHDPHNVSAIFRTADAVGIPEINLVYKNEKFPKIGSLSSASANKWIDKIKYKNVEDCISNLKKNNFTIYSAAITESAKNYLEYDFTKPTAFIIGNEHRGLSPEAIKNSDEIIKIPMMGMVQSLNVSVATAILLFELYRQRLLKKMYQTPKYTAEEMNEKILNWQKK